MSVENGYGSRKNDVRNYHGLIGPWTVMVRGGFIEHVEVHSAYDLMKHGITVSPHSVGDTFGPEEMKSYSEWLEKRQPKNGK